MGERQDLLNSVAATIKDYRAGEVTTPSSTHVEMWLSQFDGSVQMSLLRAINGLFEETYISRAAVSKFFAHQIKYEPLAGKDPCAYWKTANFLQIQKNGNSQAEICEIFDEALQKNCGLSIDDCGARSGPYFYLDDVMFSGSRVASDLIDWVNTKAPQQASLRILVMATHTSGEWFSIGRIKEAAKKAGKNIHVECWAARRFENRKTYRDTSEVLWPTVMPNDPGLTAYVSTQRYPPELRKPISQPNKVFSSEAGRQVLEGQLLLAGMKIRSFSKRPKDVLRPLGFGPFGIGFGAVVTTYRNCPNNCPLALWWGDPTADSSHPFSKWYPLLPRKTYGSATDW